MSTSLWISCTSIKLCVCVCVATVAAYCHVCLIDTSLLFAHKNGISFQKQCNVLKAAYVQICDHLCSKMVRSCPSLGRESDMALTCKGCCY